MRRTLFFQRSQWHLAIFVFALLISWMSVSVFAEDHENNGDNDDHGNNNNNDGSSHSYSNGRYVMLNNCKESTVQMTAMNILCKSQNTYYYQNNNHNGNGDGNGGYQNNGLCNYGDNFQINADFRLNHNLDYDDEIYMTMGIFAASNATELLYSARAVNLCSTLVKEQCTTYGRYSFFMNGTFDTLSSCQYNFMPLVQIGFSNRRDEGYNLGGTNIDCDYDVGYVRYTPWLRSNQSNIIRKGNGNFFAKYGILLGVLTTIVVYALVLSRRWLRGVCGDCSRSPQPWNEELLIVHTQSQVGSVP